MPTTTKKRPLSELSVETVIERFGGHIVASRLKRATKKDLAEAQKLHAQGKCPCNVVYDESGWMYDFRYCAVCGKALGSV